MNARRKDKVKMNIPMCAACVLLCLTMFSIYLMSGLYARYVTTASGGDGARVAKFGEATIAETGDFVADGSGKNVFKVAPGVNLKKDARVSYTGSEVAVYLFVKVDASDNWEIKGVTGSMRNYYVYASGGNFLLNLCLAPEWETLSNAENVCFMEVEPNTPLDGIPLISSDGTIVVSKTVGCDEMLRVLNNDGKGTYINFTAYVVQAGGFNTPEAAWASVKNR